jgi:uncharacterized membrane protein
MIFNIVNNKYKYYMNKHFIISRNKNKLLIISLLLIGSLISVFLAKARMLYSGSNEYSSLIWNLFLAWIPLLLSVLVYLISWSKRWLWVVSIACTMVWLLFFPNAPYILTDFNHLSTSSSNAPLWFDVIMVIWFAWTGLLLGVVSLHLMHGIVTRLIGRISGWIFTLIVISLGGIGISLGRFLRWNSWDVLQEPLPILHDVWDWIRYPFSNLRIYGFTILYTLLFLFVYLAFRTFSSALQEQINEQNQNP